MVSDNTYCVESEGVCEDGISLVVWRLEELSKSVVRSHTTNEDSGLQKFVQFPITVFQSLTQVSITKLKELKNDGDNLLNKGINLIPSVDTVINKTKAIIDEKFDQITDDIQYSVFIKVILPFFGVLIVFARESVFYFFINLKHETPT